MDHDSKRKTDIGNYEGSDMQQCLLRSESRYGVWRRRCRTSPLSLAWSNVVDKGNGFGSEQAKARTLSAVKT